MPTFTELQDDAALLSLEHQLRFADVLGLPSWYANFDEKRFELTTDGNTTTCTDMQVLGSAAPGPRSWLWAWANPTGYREDILLAANEAREYGEQHGIPELANGEVPFDALPGSPTEPAHVTALMMEATKAVTGRFTGYQGPVGGGTRVGFLLDHPEFRLPAPEGPRISRVVQQGLTELFFYSQRRGVSTYAQLRGLGLAHNADMTRISGPGFTIDMRFNERHQFVAMTTNFNPQPA